MAVKAVASVYFVNSDSGHSGKFKCNISMAGIVPGNLVDATIQIDDVDPGITALDLEAAIKQAVKDELINNYSYSFGLFDTVRLIGGVI